MRQTRGFDWTLGMSSGKLLVHASFIIKPKERTHHHKAYKMKMQKKKLRRRFDLMGNARKPDDVCYKT